MHHSSSMAGRTALDVLLANDMVACKSDLVSHSEWVFTDRGMEALHIQQLLPDPRLVLVPRQDVPAAELTTFDLMHHLAVAGWEARVWVPRPGGPRLPPAYSPDGDRVWWVGSKTVTVSSAYLSALHLAGEHGREVPHFRADSFYRALVTGDLAGDLGPTTHLRAMVMAFSSWTPSSSRMINDVLCVRRQAAPSLPQMMWTPMQPRKTPC